MVAKRKFLVGSDQLSVAERFDVLGCLAAQIEVMAEKSEGVEYLPQINADATVMLRGLSSLRAVVLKSGHEPKAKSEERVLGNSWPRAIPVAERMPAKPDADCLDEYFCFIDKGFWTDLGWDGEDFLLDSSVPVTKEVTHWMPKPPDPPRDAQSTPEVQS